MDGKKIVELPEGNSGSSFKTESFMKHRAKHEDLLSRLLLQVNKVDFYALANFTKGESRLIRKHYLICTVEHVLKLARDNDWGITVKNEGVYLYNKEYWSLIDKNDMEIFLGMAAEKMGVDKFDAKHYVFREQLFKQFMFSSLQTFNQKESDVVLVNLLNGTFEISADYQELRNFNRHDFLTYQLPFEYNPLSQCPLFNRYLDEVLPDLERQRILAEYIGYLFIKNNVLKMEKTLLLYGTGANGKSVFFEIMSALLGKENICNYSLQNLTNENGYYRAKLANKLVNYASEINGKLEASFFKQLVSGEPVEARAPYGEPFSLKNYAKLIFNCNELPKDVEQTQAFFRRFLIIPFEVTIAEENQDKELAKKIIENELSGIFNWVLSGLKRLMEQKHFTRSKIVKEQIELYRKQSDTVQLFLEDNLYIRSASNHVPVKIIYLEYRTFCVESGYKNCSLRTFSDRLKAVGFDIKRRNIGYVIFMERGEFKEIEVESTVLEPEQEKEFPF